jgi:hypothetical protein
MKNIYFFLITVFVLFSCSTEKKESCVLQRDNVSANFKVIFMDTTIKNGEYPKLNRVPVLYYRDDRYSYQINKLLYGLYYRDKEAEDAEIDKETIYNYYCSFVRMNRPATFQIEIKKVNDPVDYKSIFIGWQDTNTIDYLCATVWVTDENCNEYGKVPVLFYKNGETDSSYILTTQVIKNNKFVAGYPIFFHNDELRCPPLSFGINTRETGEYQRNFITSIPAGLTRFENSGRISVEILLDYYWDIKDTIETIIAFSFPYITESDNIP